ncbi:hypothetical protein [Pseudomonas sp. dw_358]|uniref:hypothetical protein n=1 Tax=Pseudomonas sp. dw_358 TaxID=2720083 RepID=UPI001BD4B636|nr:hypothetical protein [Pseudomonas sp. dw_358]
MATLLACALALIGGFVLLQTLSIASGHPLLDSSLLQSSFDTCDLLGLIGAAIVVWVMAVFLDV